MPQVLGRQSGCSGSLSLREACFPNALEEAKSNGIALAPEHMPRKVFDKRAAERNQAVFYDMSYIKPRPRIVNLNGSKRTTTSYVLR